MEIDYVDNILEHKCPLFYLFPVLFDAGCNSEQIF